MESETMTKEQKIAEAQLDRFHKRLNEIVADEAMQTCPCCIATALLEKAFDLMEISYSVDRAAKWLQHNAARATADAGLDSNVVPFH